MSREVGEVIVKFYYLRDKDNSPRITRCIVKDGNGNVGVGTAICSYLDSPNKKIGKRISFGRAMKALRKCKSYSNVARDKAKDIIHNIVSICFANKNIPTFLSLGYKGLFVPSHKYGAYLSEYEKQLLFNAGNAGNVETV